MLIMGVFDFLADPMHALSLGFHSIMLWLDAIVYEFVARMYNIFILLAETNIFSQDFYRSFSQRIYAVLGVVMLFVLAYALLQALIDPDKLTKGDKGIGKMVPTFVTSLIIIGLLPTIFDFAFNVQNFILEENTIGVLVLGSSVANSDTEVGNGGALIRKGFGVRLAYTSLHTFLNQENELCGEDEGFNGITCQEMEEKISSNASNFMIILNMADAIADGDIAYRWGFSTGVGLFLVYVIATFCLDLAVRAARLAFLQLMAPIPVLMRVLPTKNDMFKNWLKKTIACFTEVFVRVFIMYLAVYFISNFELNWSDADGLTAAIANVLVIMGILMFVKEFPKLLSDITGIDSGNIKLGIKDFMGKLGAGGALGVAAVAGAGLTTGIRNTVNGWRHGRIGIGSGIAGALSASARAAKGGFTAKNFADTRKAATDAVSGATKAREDRSIYKASHGGTIRGAMQGHLSDAWKDAKSFVGFGPNIDALKRQQTLLSEMGNKRKEMADKAEAEIMKKPGKMFASSSLNVDGVDYNNLSVLDNVIDMVKNKGFYKDANGNTIRDANEVARHLNDLQNARAKLKDNMVNEYINGTLLDDTGATVDMAGPVKEAFASYHTAMKNNVGSILANLTEADLRNPDVQNWKNSVENYLSRTNGMTIDAILNDAANLHIGEVSDDAKKYIGRASTNVNTQINTIRQQEAARQNNGGGGNS